MISRVNFKWTANLLHLNTLNNFNNLPKTLINTWRNFHRTVTIVMLIWCLKQVKFCVLKLPLNESFFWGTQNYYMSYIQYYFFFCFFFVLFCFFYFRWKRWWHVGEFVVSRRNYRECLFDLHFVQCQTTADISGIANELVQYVQNYFQYVHILI